MSQTNQTKRPSKLQTLLLLPPVIKTILTVVVTAVVAAAILFAVQDHFSSRNQTTKLGFEDLGELATQSAYCTKVNVTEASRELFGMTIPFTQSKYIYSYNVEIKAGFDFREIEYTVNDTTQTIQVKLPQAEILSNEIDLDSFQVYHEEESIFRPITLEENNQAMNALKQSAEEDAVANGLLDEARANAETILNGFFGQAYDLDEYAVTYVEK